MEHIININTELIRRLAFCERVWSKLKLQQNGGAPPAGITLLIVYPSEVDHAALVADRQRRGKLRVGTHPGAHHWDRGPAIAVVETRYTFECDEGPLILLTVADALGLPARLVEITLPGGSGDNFVRWQIDEKTIVDWDMNGRAQCIMPLNIPSFQGEAMSHEQTLYIVKPRAPPSGEKFEFQIAAS